MATCTGTGIAFGNQTQTCTTGLPGGAVVTAVSVQYSLDIIHTDNNTPASSNFSFDGPGVYDFSGTVDDNNRPVSTTFNVTPADFALFSGANFAIGDSYTNAVNVAAYNVGTVVTITYDVAPPAEAPEPSAFILIGSALSGLGIYARRRKA